MKTLSVKQPFAGLIAAGRKKMECRSWNTSYRGELLIHTSQAAHLLYIEYNWTTEEVCLANFIAPERYHLPRLFIEYAGQAICVVDLVDVERINVDGMYANESCCDTSKGDFLWKLENPRLVQGVYISGKLGLFETPESQIIFI